MVDNESFEDRELKAQLARLRQSPTLPPQLEHLVVSKVDDVWGLTTPKPWRLPLAALTAVLLFVSGMVVGHIQWSAPLATEGRQFLILVHESPEDPLLTDTQAADRATEYGEWAAGLARAGYLVTASELAAESRMLGPGTGSSGPSSQSSSSVGGFFLIRADDLAEATQIASTCPHLNYQGRVEVRPLRR